MSYTAKPRPHSEVLTVTLRGPISGAPADPPNAEWIEQMVAEALAHALGVEVTADSLPF